MAHHRHHGRSGLQVLGPVGFFDFLLDDLFKADDRSVRAKTAGDFFGRFAVERLIDGRKQAPVQELLDDVFGANFQFLRELLDRDALTQGDLPRNRDFFGDHRPGRSEMRSKGAVARRRKRPAHGRAGPRVAGPSKVEGIRAGPAGLPVAEGAVAETFSATRSAAVTGRGGAGATALRASALISAMERRIGWNSGRTSGSRLASDGGETRAVFAGAEPFRAVAGSSSAAS